MTTFNSLGTEFADLEDKVKKELAGLEDLKASVIANFSAFMKQGEETRDRILKDISIRMDGIQSTLGYSEAEPETEPAVTAENNPLDQPQEN
jgi:hypothetical protein